jgi:hypothetical protein
MSLFWLHCKLFRRYDDVVYDCDYEFEKKIVERERKRTWVQKGVPKGKRKIVSRKKNGAPRPDPKIETKKKSRRYPRRRIGTQKKSLSKNDSRRSFPGTSKIERTEKKAKKETASIDDYFNNEFITTEELFFCTEGYKCIIKKHVLPFLTGSELLSLSLVNITLRSYVADHFYDTVVSKFVVTINRRNDALRRRIRLENPMWTRTDLYRHPEYLDVKTCSITHFFGKKEVSYNLGLNRK